MSYQALARQFRPKNFTELVGQEHVSQALINGLNQNRLHHAFLFTGTRGVGKTTIARILAKALNCEQGVSGNPCGECQACNQIDEGKFVDLIEVDAASRTGVDDTRELLDNVQYAPTSGRYKIYLIDEVHMFSRSSFNALLKTLEEPPEHVKFLLATTEPEKLPVTVLSRCLQFNLKRLNLDQIKKHLIMLLEKQNLQYDQNAVELLARAADGSMRDGLSLLDQSLAFGAGQVKEQDVKLMLGTINQNSVIEILDNIIDGNTQKLSENLQQIYQLSPDYSLLLHDIALLLHELSLIQILNKFTDYSQFDRVSLKSLLNKTNPEQIQLYYEIVIKGQDNLKLAPDYKTGFEMTILRMLAFKIGDPGKNYQNKTVNKDIESPESTNIRNQPSLSSDTHINKYNEKIEIPDNAFSQTKKYKLTDFTNKPWSQIFNELSLTGFSRELARNVKIKAASDGVLEFLVDTSLHNLITDKSVKKFKSAITELISEKVTIKLTECSGLTDTIASHQQKLDDHVQQDTRQKVEQNPFVKHMQDNFDAELIQIKNGEKFLEV